MTFGETVEKKGKFKGRTKHNYWHSFHSLRGTGATAYLEMSDGDIDLVGRLCRHQSTETTRIYARRYLKSMRDKLNAAYRGEIKRTVNKFEMEDKREILRESMAKEDLALAAKERIQTSRENEARLKYAMQFNQPLNSPS
jgi:hypothetical protein